MKVSRLVDLLLEEDQDKEVLLLDALHPSPLKLYRVGAIRTDAGICTTLETNLQEK